MKTERTPLLKLVCALSMLPAATALAVSCSVTEFGADGSDAGDDFEAFRKAMRQAVGATGQTVVTVPAGTYYLSQPISIYSRTTLRLDANAVIRPLDPSVKGLLRGQHADGDGVDCQMDETCAHGGYAQVQNVVVEGGVWDCACTANPSARVYGIRIVHGECITIRNLTLQNATDHFINLSGCRNTLVQGVVFKDMVEYTGHDPDFWNGMVEGDKDRYDAIESVHLDFIENDGEDSSYPVDGTLCRNVAVVGCRFVNVFAGVGTHHLPVGSHISKLAVSSCSFDVRSYPLSAYGYEDVVFSGNTVTSCKSMAYLVDSKAMISTNTCTGAKVSAIRGEVGSSFDVIGNQIVEPGEAGVVVSDAGTRARVVGNRITKPGTIGVYVTTCGSGFVQDNVISNAVENGLSAVDGATLYACGNTIGKTDLGAVALGAETVVRLVDNRIADTTSHGAYVSGGARMELRGNEISEAQGSGFVAIGSGSVLSSSRDVVRGTGFYGAQAADGAFVSLFEAKLSKVGQQGVYVKGDNSKMTLVGCRISDVPAAAMRVEGGTLTARRNETSGTAYGCYLLSAAHVEAVGNIIKDVGVQGFCVTDGACLVARGNQVESPSNAGFYLTAAGASELTDNMVSNALNGVWIVSSDDVQVIGNGIFDSRERGVYAGSSARCVITGNHVSGTQQEGIFLHKGVDGLIARNDVAGASGIGIRIEGAEGEVASARVLCNRASSESSQGDVRVCANTAGCEMLGNQCLKNGFGMSVYVVDVTTYKTGDANGSAVFETDGTLTVSWERLAGITGYSLEYSDGVTTQTVSISDPLATSYVFPAAVAATIQSIYVRSLHTGYLGHDYESAQFEDYRIDVDKTRVKLVAGADEESLFLAKGDMVSVGVPSRTGCVFGGYWTKPFGQGVQYWGGDGAPTRAWDGTDGPVELYAAWAPSFDRLVSFDSRGGEADAVSVWVVAGKQLTALPEATRVGYDFAGWFVGESDEKATVEMTVNADVTLVAHWTQMVPPENDDPEPGADESDPDVPGSDEPGPKDPKPEDPGSEEPTPQEPVEPEPKQPGLFANAAETPFVGNETYVGWVRGANGEVKGTLTVKAAKPAKNGQSKLSVSYVPFGGKKQSIKLDKSAMPYAGGRPEVAIPELGTVRFGGDSLAGVDFNLEAGADLTKTKDKAKKDAAKSRLAAKAGMWTFAFETSSGYAAFSVTVSNKGKGKLAGTLPDGTKVSVSTQGVLGEKALALPFLYSKKGSLGFVFWIGEDRSVSISDLTKVRLASGAICDAKVLPPSASHRLANGGHEFAFGDVVQAFEVVGKKWNFPKQKKKLGLDDPNPYATKLTFTEKTGAVKGAFSLPSATGKAVKFTVTGMVVGNVMYGTAVNKTAGSITVVAQ